MSIDIEELCVTHYDWMRMTGRLLMTLWSEPFESSSSQGQKWWQMESVALSPHNWKWHILGFNDLPWFVGCVEDLQDPSVCPPTRSLLRLLTRRLKLYQIRRLCWRSPRSFSMSPNSFPTSFPNQKVKVVSEIALMPGDLLGISLEEVIFTTERLPEVILC